MTPKTKIIAADRDWIKRQLKPENSYIVFENSPELDEGIPGRTNHHDASVTTKKEKDLSLN